MSLGLLFLLWALSKYQEPTAAVAPATPKPRPPRPKPHGAAPHPLAVDIGPATMLPTAVTPPAWPAVLPDGLPPFPGPGWALDSPPGPGVAARALALLPQLWEHGEGTTTTEQTQRRWITYRATLMANKRGVVAYKLAAPPATAVPPAPVIVVPHPAAAPVPNAAPLLVSLAPHAAAPSPSPSAPLTLPMLRLTHPNTTGPSVVYLQQRLGIKADGVFGSGTDRAVRLFQQSHGLQVDGIVGKNTWTALG